MHPQSIALAPKPCIYEYEHYVPYLLEFIDFKRAQSSYWSLGAWSKRLKLSSTAVLTNILKKRKPLTLSLAKKMLPELALSSKEQEYFLLLVEVYKEEASDKTQSLLKENVEHLQRAAKMRKLELLKFETIADPKHFLLREMFHLRDHRDSVEWVQSRSRLHTSQDDIQKSIEHLIQVNLLRRNQDGKLEVQNELYDVTHDASSEAVHQYHHNSLRNAAAALDEIPREKRLFNSITLSLSEEAFPIVSKKIEEFGEKLLALYAKEGDMVYQINLQFFPLTHEAPPRKSKNE